MKIDIKVIITCVALFVQLQVFSQPRITTKQSNYKIAQQATKEVSPIYGYKTAPNITGIIYNIGSADPLSNSSEDAIDEHIPIRKLGESGIVVITKDPEYYRAVINLLLSISAHSPLGRFIAIKTLCNERVFVMVDSKTISMKNGIKTNTLYNTNSDNYRILFFELEGRRSIGYVPTLKRGENESVLVHEFDHFIQDEFRDGAVLLENHTATNSLNFPATEVRALVHENVVRQDFGLSPIEYYGGVRIVDKMVIKHKSYRNTYVLTDGVTPVIDHKILQYLRPKDIKVIPRIGLQQAYPYKVLRFNHFVEGPQYWLKFMTACPE